MDEGSVECANCGRANPAWAQVCRSCGAPIRMAATQSSAALPGPIAGLDQGSLLAIGGAPGTTFCHSIELTAPFGVTQIGEGVSQINKDGSEALVINPEENLLTGIDPEATVDGFTVPTNALLKALGAGTFVMRVYRGTELLAQGTFTLTE